MQTLGALWEALLGHCGGLRNEDEIPALSRQYVKEYEEMKQKSKNKKEDKDTILEKDYI